MRIAITSTGPNLGAEVDPFFGRCSYFLFVQTEDLSFEAVENPNAALGGGAGIQSGQLVAERGADHVLTGNCGPKAFQTLSAAGIGVSVGCSGPVRDAVEQFKKSPLAATAEPNVASHSALGVGSPEGPGRAPGASLPSGPGTARRGGAMGSTQPVGMGRGAGRGMGPGRGAGRGMGRGLGGKRQRRSGRGDDRAVPGSTEQTAGAVPPQPTPASSHATPGHANDDELAILRKQAEQMAQQSQLLRERIRQLEGAGPAEATVAGVDAERCTGCGICTNVCPVGAISLVNDVAVVDQTTCTACGVCVSECPNEAIAMGPGGRNVPGK